MRWLAPLLSLGLVFAACKGDSTPNTPDSPPEAATLAPDLSPPPAVADDDDSAAPAEASADAPADDDSAVPADIPPEPVSGGTLKLTSTAFEAGYALPVDYTCDGKDVSPPLEWSGVPETARAVALIVDDPDAPKGTWVHWTVFNLAPDANNLPHNASTTFGAADGVQGTTSFGKVGWGGPCPPKGPAHRYYFRLYALDRGLDLDSTATRAQVDAAMKGHVVAEGWFMGRYERK
jgi:Raf kinase inhibitor-like YbhB/YbcL family protein